MEPTIVREVTVLSPNGLHARPSHAIVAMATSFDAHIELEFADRKADARSILSVMTLGAAKGDTLILRAQGPQAAEAMECLVSFFARAFEEAGA
jgi:phosphotransferase system HPr (HPr) family protein